jgi:hypothetical protein
MARPQELFLNIAGRFIDNITAMRKLRWDFALEETRRSAAERAQARGFEFEERMRKELLGQKLKEQARMRRERTEDIEQIERLREISGSRADASRIGFGLEAQGVRAETALGEHARVLKETGDVGLANTAFAKALNISRKQFLLSKGGVSGPKPPDTVSPDEAILMFTDVPGTEGLRENLGELSKDTKLNLDLLQERFGYESGRLREIGLGERQEFTMLHKELGVPVTATTETFGEAILADINKGIDQSAILPWNEGKNTPLLVKRRDRIQNLINDLNEAEYGSLEYNRFKQQLADEIEVYKNNERKALVQARQSSVQAPSEPEPGVTFNPDTATPEEAKAYFSKTNNMRGYADWFEKRFGGK